jgi:hypothetical protein
MKTVPLPFGAVILPHLLTNVWMHKRWAIMIRPLHCDHQWSIVLLTKVRPDSSTLWLSLPLSFSSVITAPSFLKITHFTSSTVVLAQVIDKFARCLIKKSWTTFRKYVILKNFCFILRINLACNPKISSGWFGAQFSVSLRLLRIASFLSLHLAQISVLVARSPCPHPT